MWRACVLGLVVAAAAAAAADIHAAVGADSPIMIREALEAGASVDTIGPGGQTPLMAAVLQGKVLASHPTQPDPHPTATNRHPRRAHVRTLPHAPGSPPSHPSRCTPSGAHLSTPVQVHAVVALLVSYVSTYPPTQGALLSTLLQVHAVEGAHLSTHPHLSRCTPPGAHLSTHPHLPRCTRSRRCWRRVRMRASERRTATRPCTARASR